MAKGRGRGPIRGSDKGPASLRQNEQIRLSPIRVIGPDGEQIGVIETKEALRMAQEAGLDLVEMAPNERPPVCRIMDYGKFKYHQKKKGKKQHEQQIKEVRVRPKTDDNDLEIKMDRALRFLKKGDKVQFKMMFRGRERAHREIGFDLFNEIVEEFGELVKVERPPKVDGRDMTMVLAPNKQAMEKLRKQEAEAGAQSDDDDDDREGEAEAQSEDSSSPEADEAREQA